MAPDLRKHSITSFQSQILGSDNSLAVVKHDESNGSYAYMGNVRDKMSPKELIHHETVAHLVEEVRELRQRCDSLEAANADLKDDLSAIKEVHSATVVDTVPACESFTSNLTGYANSEPSTSSETAVPGTDSTISKQDFEHFKDSVSDQFEKMAEILKMFKSDMSAEGVARYKLGQDLERVKHDATKTKGRLGGVEMQMKDVCIELDHLDAEQQNAHGHAGGRDYHDADKLGEMEQQLAAALAEIQDLTYEVRTQASIIDTLQGGVDGGAIQPAPQRPTAAEYASRISNVNTGRQSPEFTFIRRVLHAMTRKAEMQQKVDDTSSKDMLHVAYTQLNRCLKDASPSSDEILTADSYTGTYDELWSLRDRVVRRLITIDHYGKALDEAKRAEVYL